MLRLEMGKPKESDFHNNLCAVGQNNSLRNKKIDKTKQQCIEFDGNIA